LEGGDPPPPASILFLSHLLFFILPPFVFSLLRKPKRTKRKEGNRVIECTMIAIGGQPKVSNMLQQSSKRTFTHGHRRPTL
jgi:hypothetical protein